MTSERSLAAPTGETFVAGELGVEQRSLLAEAWRRLAQNHLAMISLGVIVILVGIAIFAPLVERYDHGKTNFTLNAQYQGMSWKHWLGTDGVGRDWYARLVYGTRTSLTIGIAAQLILLAIGVPLGLVSGYLGGKVDTLLMRITDLAYAFPDLLFILLIAQVLGPSVFNIILAIALVSWTDIARIIRGQVLSLKTTDYVLAANALGATRTRVMFRHLLPNTISPIIITATFGIPSAIFAEAALSFIGVGLPLGTPSWGTMVNDGYSAIFGQKVLVLAPSAAIGVTMLAFTFLGDGLRDALDPRTR